MSQDLRINFISSISEQYLGRSASKSDDAAIKQFFDDPQCFALVSRIRDGQLYYDNEIPTVQLSQPVLVFYKIKPGVITPDNIQSMVLISSLIGSPSSSLYVTIQRVFSPVLVKGSSRDKSDLQVQALVSELESRLRNNVFKEVDNKQSFTLEVSNLDEEVSYWTNMYKTVPSRQQDDVKFIIESLGSVAVKLRSIDTSNLYNIDEYLDTTFNTLDDIWKLEQVHFPQKKMESAMNIIGNGVTQIIQSKLEQSNIWKDDYSFIDDLLTQAIFILDKWASMCHKLTALFWLNNAQHPWSGQFNQEPQFKQFIARLQEIQQIRNAMKEMFSLLLCTEEFDLLNDQLFAPFAGINIYRCNEHTEAIWSRTVQQFYKSLEPLDARAEMKLSQQLSGISTIAELLHVCLSYTELLKRSRLKKSLVAEREAVASKFLEYVSSIQMDSTPDLGLTDMPPLVGQLYRLKQHDVQITNIEKVSESILCDLHSYKDLSRVITEVKTELKKNIKEQVQVWNKETVRALSTKSLGLSTHDLVVSFENGKLMKVNFSPELLNLVKEVRQVSVLGYNVNSKIMDAAATAKQFISRAKSLNQIATFHNTIGDRMIHSQQAMMLNSARDLAKLVHAQNNVSWSKVSEVDEYIKKMQAAVNKLARQNTQLASYHERVMDKVELLMNTDLIKQSQQWKNILKEIKTIVAEVENQFKNSKTWRTHIDYQIYKSLEYQYRKSIELLDEQIQEMNVELLFRSKGLQMNPPLHKLRYMYYKKLKKCIMTPQSFKPIGDSNIYPAITQNNSSHFGPLYSQAESVLEELSLLEISWCEWVSLGSTSVQMNIQQMIDTNSDAIDWTNNFRSSKYLAQQIAKLDRSDFHVGCFTVSVMNICNEIELQNRRFWDQMTSWLRASIIRDIAAIQSFINNASGVIQFRPQRIEDVGEANAKHMSVKTECESMKLTLHQLEERNKTLRSWTKEHVPKLEEIRLQWNNLLLEVANYSSVLGKQVDLMKSRLISKVHSINANMERFSLRWAEMRPKEDKLVDTGLTSVVVEATMKIIEEMRNEWDSVLEAITKIQEEYKSFGLEPPSFKTDEIENDLLDCERNWRLLKEFETAITKMGNDEWIVFRNKAYQKLEAFIQEWTSRLENQTKSPFTVKVNQEVKFLKQLLPNIKFVTGEVFTDKHWMEVFQIFQSPYKSIEQLVVSDILSNKLAVISNAKALQDLNARAASELVIRQAITELDVWEIDAKFTVIPHTDSDGNKISLIQDFKTVLSKVGDHQCLLQSIKATSNYRSFEDRLALWENRLSDVDQNVRNLNMSQRKWLYLEPILRNGNVEKDRFARVDRDFKYLMNELAQADFKVLSLTRIPNVTLILQQLLAHMNHCQMSLMSFLEEKRLSFPRFYFLNDEDLLEILGQPNKAEVVQTHLKKIFGGIYSVVIEDGKIAAMCSSADEVVPLFNPVEITQNVEQWLKNLEDEMKSTLKQLVGQCLRNPDPTKFPSQVLCLAERIIFTQRCEKAITKYGLNELKQVVNEQVEQYTKQQMEWSRKQSGKTSSVLQLKLKALLLDTVYHATILDDLLAAQVNSLTDWAWHKQLKFYLKSDGGISVKMADAEFDYSFEYQGNAGKLVHTPLTEVCYLTLTQAMNAGLGGNPYGPAGTGKTETVKSLGGLLGRQVLVFNCDEGIDAQSLTRILVGLVKCGTWGCFDEFNRLEDTTLSVISQQIQPIQQALRTNSQQVILLDKKVDINKNTGIFVTHNPAGKGYEGRQKLPENLKQLFRPVVMSKPDDQIIASVILHCEGFQLAKSIGSKLVTTFDMAKKLLSDQHHYDWGLRALKTVIEACGQKLRQRLSTGQPIEEGEELEMVVQAVRLNTLCKLTYLDAQRFDQLIADVFPGVKMIDAADPTFSSQLEQALKESYVDLSLIYNQPQMNKCLALHEQLHQRMGVVLVGEAGSGKSTTVRLLRHALQKLGVVIRLDVINPKAMPKQQLLGQIDLDTRHWTDGVLTSIAQQVYNESKDIQCWIECDGEVDPEWIESLNSVLDDNRLLTLPSGWRIQFGDNVHFIFETHDLLQASPATVSRMGIILFSAQDIDINGVVDSWLIRLEPEKSSLLAQYTESYFYQAISWLSESGVLGLNCSLVALIKTGLSLLPSVTCKASFAVALLHGLGANLQPSSREAFATKLFEWTNELPPETSTKFNCYFDERRSSIEAHSADTGFDTTAFDLVKTPTIKVAMNVLKTWIESQHPFILIGPPGSGKSVLLDHCFSEFKRTQVIKIYCSAYSNPSIVTQKLAEECMIVSTNSGRVCQPKNSEKLILLFLNINYVSVDKWGNNMLVSFLQQIITYKGYYDSNLEWISVDKIQIICSVHSGDNLPPRFSSLNYIFYLQSPDRNEMNMIYNAYIKNVLSNFQIVSTSALAAFLVDLFFEIQSHLSVVQQIHYRFTPLQLTGFCWNLPRYMLTKENIYEVIVYEVSRQFCDRLISEEDKIKFNAILRKVAPSWLDSSKFMSGYYYIMSTETSRGLLQKASEEQWRTLIKHSILQYGGEMESERVIVLPELLELTAFSERTLSMPGTSLMLVGKGSAGRKTAVQIVASRLNATILKPKLGKTFDSITLKADLKNAIKSVGIDGEIIYFVIEGFQLLHSDCLDVITSFISSGEVPGMYQKDELENLVQQMSGSNSQFEENPFETFKKKVRADLHMVMIVDQDHPGFISQCQGNPALLKQSNIIWCNKWSVTTMNSIPSTIITRQEIPIPPSSVQLPEAFVQIHNDTGDISDLSPRKFFTFIETFCLIYQHSLRSISEIQTRLQTGVLKISDAKATVDKLKLEANEQKELLAKKQQLSKEVLDKISFTMASANMHREELENLRKQAEVENKSLQTRKASIDVELAEIEPLVEQAQSAVGNITPEALAEIRSLRIPPQIIRNILEGVILLMGIQDTSWNSMRTFLARKGVREDIRCFDASRITKENRTAVESKLEKNGSSFNPENAKRASAAAAPLAEWVKANVRYSYVLEKIKPLEEEQAKIQRNLKLVESQISELGTGLESVDARVAKLKEQLNESTKEAAETELKLKAAQETIASAEDLVYKLNDEYTIWNDQLTELSNKHENLTVNSLLSAAFLTYLSEYSEHIRKLKMSAWASVIRANQFSLVNFLTSEKMLLQWGSEGLPTDELSRENAAVIEFSALFPLLLDPLLIATSWLQAHLKDKQIEIISQESPKFLMSLEYAVRFGKVLIIQDVNAIEPIMMPILRRDFVHQGLRKLVSVGDKLVDYSPEFKLFLITQNTNISISTDWKSVVSVVNFTVTKDGLSQQLLGYALQADNPSLQKRRIELLQQEDKLKSELYSLQENVLKGLSSSHGNILENKDLLISLQESKASSTKIKDSLEESNEIKSTISQQCDAYQPLSDYGSLLYFACQSIDQINNIYYISLSAFFKLFQNAVISSQGSDETNIKKLNLLKSVYNYVSRSLFKVDRLSFALHVCHQMYPSAFQPKEWELFTGQIVSEGKTEISKINEVIPSWIDQSRVLDVFALKNAVAELFNTLQLENATLWSEFINSSDPKSPPHCKLSPFQLVLVIQALRPDRLHSSMTQFCLTQLGLPSISPPTLELGSVINESTPSEPVLLITSLGADPLEEITTLAHSKGVKINQVALGMGQMETVANAIEESQKFGSWILLKNLHLVTSWIPTLERLIRSSSHNNFRMWLTTDPTNNLTQSLLNACIKITYESPQGVKRNMERTYHNWIISDEFLPDSTDSGILMFLLAWFHAILQERRTYIPQGWADFYEFNDTDLAAATRLFKKLFKNGIRDPSQLKYIHGLFTNAIYGCRIDNIYDLKVLQSYLNSIFDWEIVKQKIEFIAPSVRTPQTPDLKKHVQIVKQLADKDNPEWFGLPANVDRLWQRTTSIHVINQLKGLSGLGTRRAKTSHPGKKYHNINPLLKLWKKLHQASGLVGSKPLPVPLEKPPIDVFFIIEFNFAVEIVNSLHQNFVCISKFLKGTMNGSSSLLGVVNSLEDQETPKEWNSLWEGPLNPVKYVQAVMSRSIAVEKYFNSSTLQNKEVDLANLFHVETFFSSLRQQAARALKKSADELRLDTHWKNEKSGERSFTIIGLQLEGAQFIENQLQKCSPKSNSVFVMPPLKVEWTVKEKAYKDTGFLPIPLYTSSNRAKVITELNFPCNPTETTQWIQAGIAFHLR